MLSKIILKQQHQLVFLQKKKKIKFRDSIIFDLLFLNYMIALILINLL